MSYTWELCKTVLSYKIWHSVKYIFIDINVDILTVKSAYLMMHLEKIMFCLLCVPFTHFFLSTIFVFFLSTPLTRLLFKILCHLFYLSPGAHVLGGFDDRRHEGRVICPQQRRFSSFSGKLVLI